MLNHLTDHVYWLAPDATTDRPILGAVAGARGTLLVDAGNSPAHAGLLLGALARLDVAPPRFLALTHRHWGHVFGDVALDLGGVTCRIVHVGGDHGADCSIVYVEEDQVMFLGDCLGEDLYHGTPSYTTGQLFPLLERLASFCAELYLEAHNPEPVPQAQMAEEAAQLKAIGRAVERSGQDREAILAALPALLGMPPNEDQRAIVDSFIAGLSKAAIA